MTTTTQQNDFAATPKDMLAEWTELMKSHVSRLEGVLEQAKTHQDQLRSQMETAVDELSNLIKGSLALQAEMAEQWLALARGAGKKATDLLGTWSQR